MMDLWSHAKGIPDLGAGGRSCGTALAALAREVQRGVVIDIGPWMGSTTAYLALGVIEGGHQVSIHAFDLWTASDVWTEKAKAYNGIEFEPDEDLQSRWARNVRPFVDAGARIMPHKGDMGRKLWTGNDVGLLVHDAGATSALLRRALKNFGRRMFTGAHLVLMDYNFENAHEIRELMTTTYDDRYQHVRNLTMPSRAAIFVRTDAPWGRQ